MNRRTADEKYMSVMKLLYSAAGYLKGGTIRVLSEMTLHSPEAIFTLPSNGKTFSSLTIPFSVSTLSHCFTLSHFKWLCEESTRQMPLCVQSGYLAPEREDIGKLRLELYPKGDTGSDEEKVLIGIRNENTDSLLVHWEVFLLNEGGAKCHQDEGTYRISSNDGKTFSFPRHRLLSLLDSLPADELTINCHLTVLGNGEQERAPYLTTPTISTHLDLALFTFHYVPFTWTIEQFLAQLQRQFIVSKVFSLSTDSRYSFTLRLYPNKDSENVTLALCFTSTSSFFEERKINWRHSVVDTKEGEWNAGVNTDLITKLAKLGEHTLIPHRTLSNFASLLLPEDKLTIKCELWIHEPRNELPPELLNPPPPSAKNAISSLSSGVTQVHISHVNLTNSIFASQSTISAGNIGNL